MPSIGPYTMQIKLNHFIIVSLLAILLPVASVEAHEAQAFTFGRPGSAAEVNKTIHVEATDQMRLVFDSQDIHVGDVVKFVVHNSGQVDHEFGIGDEAAQREHAAEMMRMPGMMHSDPNVVSVKPGETKILIWQFTKMKQRHLVFACNVPGHYQAGMLLRMNVKP